jgi:hypothetical protein
VHPVLYGDNVHLSVKRTPEFQGHMTPQNARKTRSFKIRKRRLAHSFPLTAFKINKHHLYAITSSQVSNQHQRKRAVTLFICEKLVRSICFISVCNEELVRDKHCTRYLQCGTKQYSKRRKSTTPWKSH